MTSAKILPRTWDFKIKHFSDGKLWKFKATFCARVYRQVEGVYYFEKYTPVVSWITVRLILSLSTNQVWATKQVYFSNDFV